MPKQTKICKACGKEYTACQSTKMGDNVFRWQDVACSHECGMVYLDMVTKSRTSPQLPQQVSLEDTIVPEPSKRAKKKPVEPDVVFSPEVYADDAVTNSDDSTDI